MPSSCTSARIASAAVFGYLGASPVGDPFVRVAIAAAAVTVVIGWSRWRSPEAAACATSLSSRDRIEPSVSTPASATDAAR